MDIVCCCLVTKSCLTLLQPHGLKPDRLLCPWALPRQGYWSGLPFPPPGDLPNPGIEPASLALGELFTAEPPGKPTGDRASLIAHSVKNLPAVQETQV